MRMGGLGGSGGSREYVQGSVGPGPSLQPDPEIRARGRSKALEVRVFVRIAIESAGRLVCRATESP